MFNLMLNSNKTNNEIEIDTIKETQIEVDLCVQAWKNNHHKRNDLQALKLQIKFNNSIDDKFFREVTF